MLNRYHEVPARVVNLNSLESVFLVGAEIITTLADKPDAGDTEGVNLGVVNLRRVDWSESGVINPLDTIGHRVEVGQVFDMEPVCVPANKRFKRRFSNFVAHRLILPMFVLSLSQ